MKRGGAPPWSMWDSEAEGQGEWSTLSPSQVSVYPPMSHGSTPGPHHPVPLLKARGLCPVLGQPSAAPGSEQTHTHTRMHKVSVWRVQCVMDFSLVRICLCPFEVTVSNRKIYKCKSTNVPPQREHNPMSRMGLWLNKGSIWECDCMDGIIHTMRRGDQHRRSLVWRPIKYLTREFNHMSGGQKDKLGALQWERPLVLRVTSELYTSIRRPCLFIGLHT